VDILILIGGVALMLLAGLFWWAMSARPSSTSRVTLVVGGLRDPQPELLVGYRACRECHPGESAQYSRSGHARTLRPAAGRSLARQFDGLSVDDPEYPGVTWTYALRDGRFVVDRAEAGKTQELPIDSTSPSGRDTTPRRS
jgi:hypothetical protein